MAMGVEPGLTLAPQSLKSYRIGRRVNDGVPDVPVS